MSKIKEVIKTIWETKTISEEWKTAILYVNICRLQISIL